MNNLKALAALAAVLLVPALAPMATASGTNTSCIPSGFTDKGTATSGNGVILPTEAGHYYAIASDSNARTLDISGVRVEFKVMKDLSTCDVVQDWTAVSNSGSSVSLPANQAYFLLIRALPPAPDVPGAGEYSFTVA